MPDSQPQRRRNPLDELTALGQSLWLDFIRRSLIQSGELRRLVAEEQIRGVTSNPSIFEKAIGDGEEYDAQIAEVAPEVGGHPRRIYEALAIADIQAAADVLEPVYRESDGTDGFVSLEVGPDLAHETEATVEEARRLWRTVARPNLMVKVPGTSEGLPAIRRLLAEGINVNITLLFSRHVYAEVAEAYLAALEQRFDAGEPIDRVASVASFFVSRIDTFVDREIDAIVAQASTADEIARLRSLRGKVAIANAKLAYVHFRDLGATARWQRLARAGAHPQRLLWASTSTKDAAYRDTLYVEELIGPETVNTVPPETLEAFRDHGVARPTLAKDVEAADAVLTALAAHVDLDEVTDQVLAEGITKFVTPFEKLLETVASRTREIASREP